MYTSIIQSSNKVVNVPSVVNTGSGVSVSARQ